jgi:predicted lipoprotein with Yx(FWY)xxD motif
MRRIVIVGLAAIGIAAFTACGSSSDDSGGSSGTEDAAAADASAGEGGYRAPETDAAADESGATAAEKPKKEKPSGTAIKLGDSQFGDVLFGGENDQAIYLFDVDEQDKSNCSGDCAVAWPPVFTEGTPEAVGGVDEKLLGTTERDDGTQVTYNGHPLYYYVNEGPGVVRCSNVFLNGGLWFAVNPSGDQV